MDDAVRELVEQSLHGHITNVERPSTGGSRRQYFADLVDDRGHVHQIVVRCEQGSSFTDTPFCLTREATAYRALAHSGVPIPKVLMLAPDGSILVLERLPGTSDLSTFDDGTRAEIMRSFIDAVAVLHTLDANELALEGWPRPTSAVDQARLDLAEWSEVARQHIDSIDPLIAFAGAWLEANAPTTGVRTSFVQGDTGPGNFLASVDAQSRRPRITGIVDWELAHLGDPMDDWAWIDMRHGREHPQRAELIERYESRSGIRVDEARVAYYSIAVQYRCAVTTSLAVARGGGARGYAPYLMVTQQYLRGIASALAARLEVEPPSGFVAPSQPTPRTALFDGLIDGLRSAARVIADEETRAETRNLQILVHYLRAHDAIGHAVEHEDRLDRTATFGPETDTDATFLDQVSQAGAQGDRGVLAYLLRRQHRIDRLWATLRR